MVDVPRRSASRATKRTATVIRLMPLETGGYEVTLGVDRDAAAPKRTETVSVRTRWETASEAWASIGRAVDEVIARLGYRQPRDVEPVDVGEEEVDG